MRENIQRKMNVRTELARLQTMELDELKNYWREVYGKEAPDCGKVFLRKQLSFRFQELQYGGISETAQEVLDDGSIRMTMQLESKKIDGHRRVVIPAPGADRMKQQSLLRAIRNGQRWMEMLINGEAKNITDLAAKLGLKPPYVTRVLGLNNLAPDIVEAIVNGAEPDGLSIAQIMKNIPEDWNEQRRLFGFPER